MMDKCIKAGYDEVAEKPLKLKQIEEWIEKCMLNLWFPILNISIINDGFRIYCS